MKPILFSTPMVQAILKGQKTQTRRAVKPQPKSENFSAIVRCDDFLLARFYDLLLARFRTSAPRLLVNDVRLRVVPGDLLWVRETWQHTKTLNLHPTDANFGYVYRADAPMWEAIEGWRWKPSIFMPKEACRIFLEITNVRVERLQSITEADARAEGVDSVDSFFALWQKLNGTESLAANPWVWVYEFEVIPMWQEINGTENLPANPWVCVEGIPKP